MKNYYKILGISQDAAKEEIKKAFRELAFKYHPDKNSDQVSCDRFKEINEARQVLLNDFKRFQYDDALTYFSNKSNISFSAIEIKRKKIRKRNVHLELIKETVLNKFFLAALFLITVLFTIASYKVPDEELIADRALISAPLHVIQNEPGLPKIMQVNQVPVTAIKKETARSKPYKLLMRSRLKTRQLHIARTIEPKEHTRRVYRGKINPFAVRRKPIREKVGFQFPLASAVNKDSGLRKQLTHNQMIEVLHKIRAEKQKSGSNSNCVQLVKSTSSNISNVFGLADFLKGYGFVISGREKIPESSNGINVNVMSDCISVTVGTL